GGALRGSAGVASSEPPRRPLWPGPREPRLVPGTSRCCSGTNATARTGRECYETAWKPALSDTSRAWHLRWSKRPVRVSAYGRRSCANFGPACGRPLRARNGLGAGPFVRTLLRYGKLGELRHRPPVAHRASDAERPLEQRAVELRPLDAVRIAKVDLAADDFYLVRGDVEAPQAARRGGVGLSHQEDDVRLRRVDAERVRTHHLAELFERAQHDGARHAECVRPGGPAPPAQPRPAGRTP